MTHNILVNAYRIAPDRIVAGTAGSYGLERMALTFSEEWKDVAKTVTFYPPKSRPVSVVLADGDEFDIPPEATAKSGEISFTVLGYRDGKRIFSVTGEMLVLATKNKEGVPSEEPTPSEKEQILAYVQDVKEMIDAGKIKGEDGYTPIKGVDYFDGKDGYTPIKGVDYFDGRDGYTPVKGVDYFDGKDGRDGQNGKDGKDGKDGINGKDGTSVAIASITESDEDGGENVVTFSDGNTLTVKNGSKGADGEGGGGVQSDWNQSDPAAPDYVKNRTHYTDKAFEDITWDGDTEGREVGILNADNAFYKVSDQTPSKDGLIGATLITNNGSVVELQAKDVVQASDDVVRILSSSAVAVYAPTTFMGVVFQSAGIYFLRHKTIGHTQALKAKETVHKLDPKYLPDDIGGGNSVHFGEEEPTDAKTGDFWYDESEGESESGGESVQADWNQNVPSAPDYVYGRTHFTMREGDAVVDFQEVNIGEDLCCELAGCSYLVEGHEYDVYFNDEFYRLTAKRGEAWDCIYLGNGNLVGEETEDTEPFAIDAYPDFEGDIWIEVSEEGTYTIEIYCVDEVVRKLDAKYLPDGIGGGSGGNLIIASRTDGGVFYTSGNVYQAFKDLMDGKSFFLPVVLLYRGDDIMNYPFEYISVSESNEDQIVAYFNGVGMMAFANGEVVVYEL